MSIKTFLIVITTLFTIFIFPSKGYSQVCKKDPCEGCKKLKRIGFSNVACWSKTQEFQSKIIEENFGLSKKIASKYINLIWKFSDDNITEKTFEKRRKILEKKAGAASSRMIPK